MAILYKITRHKQFERCSPTLGYSRIKIKKPMITSFPQFEIIVYEFINDNSCYRLSTSFLHALKSNFLISLHLQLDLWSWLNSQNLQIRSIILIQFTRFTNPKYYSQSFVPRFRTVGGKLW